MVTFLDFMHATVELVYLLLFLFYYACLLTLCSVVYHLYFASILFLLYHTPFSCLHLLQVFLNIQYFMPFLDFLTILTLSLIVLSTFFLVSQNVAVVTSSCVKVVYYELLFF